MKLRPLNDRIAVKRLQSEQKTAGGIVLPDTAQEKPQMGEVVAVGMGKPLDNGDYRSLNVRTGDKVLFGKYAGTEIKMDGQELLIMREDDLFAVVEE